MIDLHITIKEDLHHGAEIVDGLPEVNTSIEAAPLSPTPRETALCVLLLETVNLIVGSPHSDATKDLLRQIYKLPDLESER